MKTITMSSGTKPSMPAHSVNPEQLLRSLDELSLDPRLARVFAPEGTSGCVLYLWLLKIKHNKTNKKEHRLLFGCIIPSRNSESNRWVDFTSLGKWKVSPYEFRVRRLALWHNGQTIFSLVKHLCNGVSLSEACTQISISQPNGVCAQLSLAASPVEIAQSFRVRPVVFLDTRWSINSLIPQLKPPTSPLEIAPAFVGSLYQCNKLRLFSLSNGGEFHQDDNLAKKCLSHLSDETGLDFCHADSERLGNLEWLCLPATDQYENSQVRVTNPDTNSVSIEVLPDSLPIGTQCLVRCCGRSGGVTVIDQCRIVQSSAGNTQATFQAKEQIHSAIITIWTHQPGSEAWEIWYQHSCRFRWQLNLNVGNAGPEIYLPSDWLQKFVNTKKVRPRATQLQIFRQVYYERMEINREEPESWVTAAQRAREFAKALFPEKSNGQFFRNGWGVDGEPGRLIFFEWLQSLTQDPNTSRVVIIDPFFDSSGIVELIARVKAAQAEYVVLTNSQVKSKDDSTESADKAPQVKDQSEPPRAVRLKATCQELTLLLQNLKFRLLDLRSKGEAQSQLFHDRYILFFNASGHVQTGYHLSNSIQGATKSHPILITPIPSDTLPDVAAYVRELLDTSTNASREMIQLFPSMRETTPDIPPRFQLGIAAVPDASLFFATFLQDKELLLDADELAARLQGYNLFNTDTNEFVSNMIASQIESYLDQFAEALINASSVDFRKLWAALSKWLRQLFEYEQYLSRIAFTGGEALAHRLQAFLSEVPICRELPLSSFSPEMQRDALQLIEFIRLSFPEAVQQSACLLSRADCGWATCSQAQGIKDAAIALSQQSPGKLIRVIADLHQSLPTVNAVKDATQVWPIRYTLALLIQQTLEQLNLSQISYVANGELVSSLLNSNVPALRAITGYKLSPLQQHQQTDVQQPTVLMNKLSRMEQIYTLAEWVFQLRARGNRNSKVECPEDQALRLTIFDQIRQSFPEDLCFDNLESIVRRLSGPSEGDWAKSTTEDLLQPLINEGKLTIDQVAKLWLSALFNQLGESALTTPKKQNDLALLPTLEGQNVIELVEMSVRAIAKASPECRQVWLCKLKKLHQEAQRLLDTLFGRSRKYEVWHSAGICLLWLEVFAISLVRTCDENSVSNDFQEGKYLTGFVSQLDEILAATHETNPQPSKQCLWDYVAQLKES